jgi:TRAP-type mannitol/chloroaromatic compound transport system substrate-binding protein
LKAVVAHACAAEAAFALAEMDKLNAQALAALIKDHGVTLAAFPDDLIAGAREQARAVLGEFAVRSDLSGKVSGSYEAFHKRSTLWSRVSIESVLRARRA